MRIFKVPLFSFYFVFGLWAADCAIKHVCVFFRSTSCCLRVLAATQATKLWRIASLSMRCPFADKTLAYCFCIDRICWKEKCCDLNILRLTLCDQVVLCRIHLHVFNTVPSKSTGMARSIPSFLLLYWWHLCFRSKDEYELKVENSSVSLIAFTSKCVEHFLPNQYICYMAA